MVLRCALVTVYFAFLIFPIRLRVIFTLVALLFTLSGEPVPSVLMPAMLSSEGNRESMICVLVSFRKYACTEALAGNALSRKTLIKPLTDVSLIAPLVPDPRLSWSPAENSLVSMDEKTLLEYICIWLAAMIFKVAVSVEGVEENVTLAYGGETKSSS